MATPTLAFGEVGAPTGASEVAILTLMLGEWQQGGEAGAFDGIGHTPLVFGTVAGAATRGDFILMGQKVFKQSNVFIIKNLNVVGAEITLFSFVAFCFSCVGCFVSHANYVEIYERSEINFTTELSTPSAVEG